ncbi:hypothetical protein ABVT39_027063 [Epinephelus coioides]
MEVQSGVQQPEPRPLGSPRSGANQENEFDDRQTDASGRPSADNHSKDAQPASQKDDKKPSAAVRGYHSSKTAATGSSGGQGAWSGPSFTRTNLQHYLSHHQQHPHHSQSPHTSYAYCPAHTACHSPGGSTVIVINIHTQDQGVSEFFDLTGLVFPTAERT